MIRIVSASRRSCSPPTRTAKRPPTSSRSVTEHRPNTSVPCLLVVCSDVAERPGTQRHNPASETAESRTKRYRLTLRALIRYQSSGLLICWTGTAGERAGVDLVRLKAQVNAPVCPANRPALLSRPYELRVQAFLRQAIGTPLPSACPRSAYTETRHNHALVRGTARRACTMVIDA
jgi:hypothetical protein